MSRDICVYLNFLTESHQEQIRRAADAAGFTPHFFKESQFEEAKECLQHCEVLYAHSPSMLRAAPATLKWYCCAFAGIDPYCNDPTIFANPECILTNSNCYGVTIAEHTVMVTLMMLRRMPEYIETIRNRRWDNRLPVRSIRGSVFTILGTGDIGSNVARSLRVLGAARVTGLNRSGNPHPDFDAVYPLSAMETVFPETDVLIMALPSTAETRHTLNRRTIGLLPRRAFVVNVGRGSAIHQEDLAEALNSGLLAGAALDVFDPEPLPPDHFFWTTKNLIITPHCSGDTSLGYTCDRNVELFCADLANYAAGRPMNGAVDKTRGY